MRYMGLTLPFPTRMTIVRLNGRDLWVHSPTLWDDALAPQIERLGQVRYLVAPNTLHYSSLPDWRCRFPGARTYGAPGLRAEPSLGLRLDETLGEEPPACWRGVFSQCVVPGKLLTEVVGSCTARAVR